MGTSIQQIEANRRNAQRSTGPSTPQGKAASAANSTKYGLFEASSSPRPSETALYEHLRDRFLDAIRPQGVLEESLALRIVNAHLRLHRCDAAESALPVLASSGGAHDFFPHSSTPGDASGQQNEPNPGGDIHDFSHPAQAAIDRARAAADKIIRRATNDLEHLQGERWRRATLKLTGPMDPADLGLAPIKEAMSDIPTDSQRKRLMVRSGMMQREPVQDPVLQNEANPAAPLHPPAPADVGRNEAGPCGPGSWHAPGATDVSPSSSLHRE